MMKRFLKNAFPVWKKAVLTVALCAAGTLCADNDVDIPVNGDFKGAVPGTANAPGWGVQTPGMIVQGKDADDFAYELTATGAENFFASSAYYVAPGAKMLKIEGDTKGVGTASVGFEAFDANGALLTDVSAKKSFAVNAFWTKFKLYYMLDNPRVASVRLIFAVAPGSKIAFGDIDADFLLAPNPYEIAAAQAAPVAQTVQVAQAAPVAQVAPVAVAAATPVAPVAQAVPAAPVAQAAPAAPAVSAPQTGGFAGTPIIDDHYYSLAEFSSGNYTATVIPGKDVEFKLAANVSKGQIWRVESYNPAICTVKMKYDEEGFWPFRYDQAEIEIKGVSRGTCDVVFLHSSGVRATVKVEVF